MLSWKGVIIEITWGKNPFFTEYFYEQQQPIELYYKFERIAT